MNHKIALIFGGVALFGTAAHAQLVFGSTYYSGSNAGVSGAFYLDVQTGNAQQLWTGANMTPGNGKVDGLAADEANRVLYRNSAARLYKWDYNSPGSPGTFINGFYRLGTNNVVYATGVSGLTTANGKLYAYTNFNASGGNNVIDGIYEVDTTISGATPNMTLKWQHSDLAYDLEGFEFNPLDGLFYAANTSNNVADHGIYTVDVFGTGAVNKVASFDPFLATPDGLAIGGGHIWLTGKQSGTTELRIVGYNMSTGVYDEAFSMSGFPTTGYASGATWAPNALTPVPEPASMAALGLGALALIRKRRKK